MRAAAESQSERTWRGVLYERFYTRPDRTTANSKVAFVKKIDAFLWRITQQRH